MKFKKLLPILPLPLLSVFALSGCDSDNEVKVLRVLNCEDYIYEYEEGDEEYSSGGNDYKMNMIEQFELYYAATYNEEIKVGDYVSIPALNINGIVKRIKDGKATISSDGGMTLNVSVDKLHKLDRKPTTVKVKRSDSYDSIIKTDVGLELNIIGQRVDEARISITKYLDDCRVKHFKTVRIIHGFGSGALRKLTHEILSKQKDLTFTLGGASDGGGGATVVTFK